MHDIKSLRDDPSAFDKGLARRGLPAMSADLLVTEGQARELSTKIQAAQEKRNALSKEIGPLKAKGDPAAEALMAEVNALKASMTSSEVEMAQLQEQLSAKLAQLPNIPADEVPQGEDEHGNVERHKDGTPKVFDFTPKQHFELGEALGLMDFETAAKMSGARFVILKGALSQLERALGSFMLDLHTGTHGYTEVTPPLLVRDEAVFGTAQLPKFADDLFCTKDGRWLIPTSEVPLTNIARETIHDDTTLPMRLTAQTPCFRAEAGAAGRDTRGMIRLHQFMKVELVSITTPEQSEAEHKRMLGCAETVLKQLGLPFRTITLCTGDMGFSARKTYDIEVWLPGQNAYREISSCSNCGDFQARRMGARFRKAGEKGAQFVHTLNGSGVAVGRCLVAVLENYQNADGSITVPDVLRPYMGGKTKIEKA